MRILGYKKTEFVWVLVVLCVIGLATYLNLQVSLRRGRDVQRKSDIKTIHDGLLSYFIDESSFPQAFEGKIVACFGGVDDRGIAQAIPCDWSRDGLANIWSKAVYLLHLPTDPHHNDGARYYYISNGRYFQLYAALEGRDEAEYDENIVKRNIMCGDRVCNFGLSSYGAPLDKSIEEYENELRTKSK